MFQFFDFLVNITTTIVEFVIGLFDMLRFAIAFIVQGVVYALVYINYLPKWVLPFACAVIAWSVLCFIINR